MWDKKWGLLPGMTWKHERPLEEMLREEMGDDAISIQASTVERERQETREAPPRSISKSALPTESKQKASGMFGAPQREPMAAIIPDTFGSNNHESMEAPLGCNPFRPLSPAQSTQASVSDDLKTSPQEPRSALHPTELPSGYADHSSTTSHTRRHYKKIQEHPCSSPRRMRRRGDRELSVEVDQPPQANPRALSAVNPSKVSKARRKIGLDPQHLPKASESPSDTREPLASLNVLVALSEPSPEHPRRSRRLREAERKMAKDPTDIDAAIQCNSGFQSRPGRIHAGTRSES